MVIFNQQLATIMFMFLITRKVRVVFSNEDKILVLVLRQDKGY